MTAGAPNIVMAMDPDRTAHVLTPDHRARLSAISATPIADPRPDIDPSALPDILVTGWGCRPLTPEVVERMPNLGLIVHAAGSVRGLLPDLVWQRGIVVVSAAAANALPVAEYTLAAILQANKGFDRFRRLFAEARGSDHRIAALAASPIGNVKKTVGIVGASLIGRLVMDHLRRFDVEVLLSDPYVTDASAFGARLVGLEELMACDVVSLHAPLTAQTIGMIGEAELAHMRDGATLINTARGAIVDTPALTKEIMSGRIDAILDVTDPEPLPTGSPLWDAPNAILTPHIAGALGVERNRLGDLAVAEVERYVAGQPLLHSLDPAQRAVLA